MATEKKIAEVDYARQAKAFETCGVALGECSDEERKRVLASLVIMFGNEDEVLDRIDRTRGWRR